MKRKTTLTDGSPVTPDHKEIDPKTGLQKAYVVLADEERAVRIRPYRDWYKHLKCGGVTTMGKALAETYATDPFFYSGTYCTTCRGHFPVGENGEFVWLEADGSVGPKVGT